MGRNSAPPTKHQRKQLAEIKRRTGTSMSEGMTFELARQSSTQVPYSPRSDESEGQWFRKGFVKRDAERRRRKAA